MTRSKANPEWVWLLSQISDLWKAKKQRPLMLSGQDAKLLKVMMGWFTPPELASLYRVYTESSPYWGPRCGYLVSGMFQERSVLLENPKFGVYAKEYQSKTETGTDSQVLMALGLGGKKL